MARFSLALLLSVAVASPVSGHGFLDHLPKIRPATLAKQPPAQIAKIAKESVAEAAHGAKQAAERGAANPKKAAEAAEAAVKHVEQEHEAAEVLDGTGEALKRAAQAAAASNASDVAKIAENTADTALPTGMRLKGFEHASKGDVEDIMRKATPQAAKAVGSVGHKVARQIDATAPRAADLVKRTGDGIADRMFGPIPKGATGLPPEIEDKIRGFGAAPILGSFLILVIGGGAVTARYFKRGRSGRSPVLLRDSEEMSCEEMGMASVMRAPTTSETEFSRF